MCGCKEQPNMSIFCYNFLKLNLNLHIFFMGKTYIFMEYYMLYINLFYYFLKKIMTI